MPSLSAENRTESTTSREVLAVDHHVPKKAGSAATSTELLLEAEEQMSATLARAFATGLELNRQSRYESIQEAKGQMSATLQRAFAKDSS